jgi:uncharacterized protein (TIGR04255 family)
MPGENATAAERLPLTETILGVQFDPIPNLTSAHLGAYWQSLGDAWRDVREAPFLMPQFERFDAGAWNLSALQLTFPGNAMVRLQIRNGNSSRMIQVQNNRFLYNWLRRPGEVYPRYDTVRPEFDREFAAFRRFLEVHGFGRLQPNQWEVTYINQILKGTLWTRPEEWGRAFRRPEIATAMLGGHGGETFSWGWHGEISPRRGRVHVEVQQGIWDTPERPETITLNITCRGAVSAELDFGAGLDLGHVALNATFQDVVSDYALAYWGLNDANA